MACFQLQAKTGKIRKTEASQSVNPAFHYLGLVLATIARDADGQ
jgi:hypothetical protein